MKALGYLSLLAASVVVLAAAGILHEKRKQPKGPYRFLMVKAPQGKYVRAVLFEPASHRLN